MYEKLARYYDLMHQSLKDDLGFILTMAAGASGPILELGCGTGRLLLPLAQAGYEITGVDNEPLMLQIAQQRLSDKAANVIDRVTIVAGDMRDLSALDPEASFGLALFPYNTLLHLQPEDVAMTLRQLKPYLRDDSQIFIDVANPYTIDAFQDDREMVLENIFEDMESGVETRQYSRSSLDTHNQVLHTNWVFKDVVAGRESDEQTAVHVSYYYQYPHQLDLQLGRSGFRLSRLMGDYSGGPFNEESERLLLLAAPQIV